MACREDSAGKRQFIYLFSNTEAKEANGLSLLCAELSEGSERDDKMLWRSFLGSSWCRFKQRIYPHFYSIGSNCFTFVKMSKQG